MSYQRRPPRIAPARRSTSSATALRCTSMSRVVWPPSLHWATTQSIASSGPAMKPSSDIVTCQITLLTGCSLAVPAGTSGVRPIPPCAEEFGQEDFRQFPGGLAAGDPLVGGSETWGWGAASPEGVPAILARSCGLAERHHEGPAPGMAR